MTDQERTIVKFLERLFNGRIQESERLLERLAKKAESEEDRELHRVLYGIYYSYTTDDSESLLFKLYSDGRISDLRQKYKEALEKAAIEPDGRRNTFLDIWIKVIDLLDKLPIPHKFRSEPVQQELSENIEEEEP